MADIWALNATVFCFNKAWFCALGATTSALCSLHHQTVVAPLYNNAGHFLIPPPPFTSKRICVACLFPVLPSPIKSTCEAIRLLGRVGVGGGREVGDTRIPLLTLEPLAHSLLAPRRDRLHARSPATVAPSVPRRPSRLLPLRAAGGGKKRR